MQRPQVAEACSKTEVSEQVCQEGEVLPFASLLLPGHWTLIPLSPPSAQVPLYPSCWGDRRPPPPPHLFPVALPDSPLLSPDRRRNTLPPGGGNGSSSSRGNLTNPSPPCRTGAHRVPIPVVRKPQCSSGTWLASPCFTAFGTRNRSILSASPAPLKVKSRLLVILCSVGNPTVKHHGLEFICHICRHR